MSDVLVGSADGSPFNPLNGIASALTYGSNSLFAVVSEVDPDGFLFAPTLRRLGILGFKFNPYNYITLDTLLVPSTNLEGSEYINGVGNWLFWNPQTQLCEYGNGGSCAAIYAWRQAEFEAEGGDSFFHKLKCFVYMCMPEDLERNSSSSSSTSKEFHLSQLPFYGPSGNASSPRTCAQSRR